MKILYTTFIIVVFVLSIGQGSVIAAQATIPGNEDALNAESVDPGVSVKEYMTNLVSASESKGNKIEQPAWISYKEPPPEICEKERPQHVHFRYIENGKEVDYHWIITPDNNLIPVSDSAKAITKNTNK